MAGTERLWWLRTLAVLHAPFSVFDAFRGDAEEHVEARAEPVNALVVLAGISSVLWAPSSGRLLDDPAVDGLLVVVLAFLTGALYGLVGYFLLGLLLRLGLRAEGGEEPKRRARHLVAYASAPLVVSLVLIWPLRLAVFGGDVFRTGGSDGGIGDDVFVAIELACVAWSLALLTIAVRVVHRWPWRRALVAVAPPTLLTAAVIAAAIFS
jgi:hypothetical protein